MTAPSPGDFETVLKSITKAMTELRSEYRWIYHAAHDRTVGDSAKVQAGPADPTGGIVGSTEKARMRREATRAHGYALDALAELRKAATALKHGEERQRDTIEFDRRHPRTATRADLAGAREAKTRREARDQGWGEA